MHLISTPEIRSSPVFVQLCLEKSSRRAWTPKAQSKSHLHEVLPNSQTAKHFDTNYEYGPNCLQRIFSQTSKHAEIGWKTMGKKGQIRDPRSATLSWIELAPSGLTRPSINFMSRIFHAGLGGQWKSKNADILAGFPSNFHFAVLDAAKLSWI